MYVFSVISLIHFVEEQGCDCLVPFRIPRAQSGTEEMLSKCLLGLTGLCAPAHPLAPVVF